MEHVTLVTSPDGFPTSVLRGGDEWLIGAEPLRWFERVNWWESERRMPRGTGRVDVEILRLQARPHRADDTELVTLELMRDSVSDGWRVRGMAAAAA